jgi:hypothetical protein
MNIFENNDILREIVKFLPFEEKIKFGKFCKKNFTKFYDFTKNISGICDVFYEVYNNDYLPDTRFTFIYDVSQEIYDEYIAIRKEPYFYEEYDYIKEEDEPDILFNDYVFTPTDYHMLKEECKEIFDKSFHSIFARTFIEMIENNGFSVIPTTTEFHTDIFDKVFQYYQTNIKKNNINLFCQICGKFGHHNTCKSCIFYSPENEKLEIKKEVVKKLDEIITICKFIAPKID